MKVPTFVNCRINVQIEVIYQIHGERPLQDGGERGVEKTWLALHRC